MIINNIELPEKLVNSLENNQLVIFAGSGVSKGSPSNLPLFEGLVDKIKDKSGVELKRKDKESPDSYLGRLKYQDIAVHEIARDIFRDPLSKPNELHRNIIKLFENENSIKLVTTNFDPHFTTTFKDIYGEEIQPYYAPALPRGEDFTGLVYLHGAVEVDNSRTNLILTDEDFGQAYFTQGFAREFAIKLFETYNVLFIGYSLNDVVMRYLTRGMPNKKAHFAFVEDGNGKEIAELGITPILYPNTPTHKDLYLLLDKLVEYRKMDFFDHRKRLFDIADKEFDQVGKEEFNYLETAVELDNNLKIFLDKIESNCWLDWFYNNNYLDDLFNSKERLTDDKLLFADWISNNFLVKNTNQVLEILNKENEELNPDFAQKLLFKLSKNNKMLSKNNLGYIIIILEKNLESNNLISNSFIDILSGIIEDNSEGNYDSIIINIIDYVLEIRLETKNIPKFTFDEHDEVTWELQSKIILVLDEYNCNCLLELMEKIISNSNYNLILALKNIIKDKLEKAFNLLSACGTADNKSSVLSFMIDDVKETSKEDIKYNNINLFILLGRDILGYIKNEDSKHLITVLNDWIKSNSHLIQRLSINMMNRVDDYSFDKKINWILNNFLLYSPMLNAELYDLIKECYKNSDNESRKKLLENIISNDKLSDFKDKETAEFAKFDLLTYIVEEDQEYKLIEHEINKIILNYPEFEGKWSHSSKHMEINSETKHFKSPFTEEEISNMAAEEVFDIIINYDFDRKYVETKHSFYLEAEKAANKNKEFAVNLLDYYISNLEVLKDDNFVIYLFEALKKENYSDQDLKNIINKLLKIEIQPEQITKRLLLLLKYLLNNYKSNLINELSDNLDQLIDRIWTDFETTITKEEIADDTLSYSDTLISGIINLYLEIIKIKNEDKPYSKKSFMGYEEILTKIISGENSKNQLAKITLSKNISFLFEIDSSWVIENLLILFSWENDVETALICWKSYILGNIGSEKLTKKLLFYIKGCFKKFNLESEDPKRFFAYRFAEIISFFISKPMEKDWMKKFINKADDELKKYFLQHISVKLDNGTYKFRETIWENWLEDYSLERISSYSNMKSKEFEQLIRLLFSTENEEYISEIINRIKNLDEEFDISLNSFYREFIENKMFNNMPELSVDLLICLFEYDKPSGFYCSDLVELIENGDVDYKESSKMRDYLDKLSQICPGRIRAMDI
ncbi:MAG: SIR2 family protein [bacterium]